MIAVRLRRRSCFIIILAVLLMLSVPSFAKIDAHNDAHPQLSLLVEEEKAPVVYQPLILPYKEASTSSWALAIDNDTLAPGLRDQDYTYGLNFTYSGSKAKDLWVSLDRPLRHIDGLLGVDNLSQQDIDNHSLEVGFFGFTPEDIKVAEANPHDRPYASLLYLSSAQEQVDPLNHIAWKSTLTIGALGLNLVGEFQNQLHEQIDANQALGWDNQISEGGELTARYAVARQQYLGTIFDEMEVKSTLQASVGYLTEVSWSLSVRDGKYHSPWSSFSPELASYGEKSTYTTSTKPILEHYFWAGITMKARAYNAFLQGQFRDSAVTYERGELNPLLVEAWIGYTLAFTEGYRVSYVIRGHSSELKEGAGNRNLVWGGIIVAKTFN